MILYDFGMPQAGAPVVYDDTDIQIAPEVFKSGGNGKNADIWTLGVILYQLMYG